MRKRGELLWNMKLFCSKGIDGASSKQQVCHRQWARRMSFHKLLFHKQLPPMFHPEKILPMMPLLTQADDSVQVGYN